MDLQIWILLGPFCLCTCDRECKNLGAINVNAQGHKTLLFVLVDDIMSADAVHTDRCTSASAAKTHNPLGKFKHWITIAEVNTVNTIIFARCAVLQCKRLCSSAGGLPKGKAMW